jgi:hypothetical protein
MSVSIGTVRWAGPVPLRAGQDLLGRRRELRELVDRCQTYDVIRITARSGVGKTSFITAGGIRDLEHAGYTVPPIPHWRTLLSHPSVKDLDSADAIAHAIYALIVGAEDAPSDRPMAQIVEQVAGAGRMAVILDQLEELLRYQPAIGTALLRLAGEVARDSRIPQIVIARSEYAEQLEPVEVLGVHVWNLRLNEIKGEKALANIVRDPVVQQGGSIGPDEVGRIVRWWLDARDQALMSQSGEAALTGGVGLLHLQSLLWSLRQWGASHGVTVDITAKDLDDFVAAKAAVHGFDPADETALGRHLLRDAVTRYVEDTVERLTAAPDASGEAAVERKPLAWRNGPRLMLSRIAPALSSGGYKVPQARSSLLVLALSTELTQRAARTLADLQRTGKDVGAFAEGTRLEGAGIAAGWSKPRLLGEMLDALDLVLRELSSENANLLRAFTVGDEPVYELIHDGIGPALTKWAQDFTERPVSGISVIAAQPGGAMWHSLVPETFADQHDLWDAARVEGGKVSIDNPRWQSNYIGPAGAESTLRLEHLTIRGGDFTGAAFVNCELRGVRFEDCQFKGAAMVGCTFEDVHFLPAPEQGDKLDLLTFIGCTSERAGVVVRGARTVTGLFFNGLTGGTWTIEDSEVRHLVASADGASELRLRGATVRHATITGAVTLTAQDSELEFAEVPD